MDQSDDKQLGLIGTSPQRYILHWQSGTTQRGVKFFPDFEVIKAIPSKPALEPVLR